MPDRYKLMAFLAAWCAMRFGELAELRRGDPAAPAPGREVAPEEPHRQDQGRAALPGRGGQQRPHAAAERDTEIARRLSELVSEPSGTVTE